MGKRKETKLTEQEIKENCEPSIVVENVTAEEEKAYTEAVKEAPVAMVKRGPKDYIEKARELIAELQADDDCREYSVAQQALTEALLFLGKKD